ncbi:hypothetical protein EZS27_026097 [termite gut metagenome]|uniref:MobA protein n=1 Tax=termite gut metagenome TaxID=433724 RepID=A0A5J4QUN2_9ZZZZ
MNIENVGNGTSHSNGKSKRGRKPKLNPQTNRCMIRLNEKDNEQFLSLYKQSGKRSISAFIADCILNKPVKTVIVNKSVLDYVMLLSQFFAQFRAIKTNYNQVFQTLVQHVGEEKARSMMKIVEKATLDFIQTKQEIEQLTIQLKEKCLPR